MALLTAQPPPSCSTSITLNLHHAQPPSHGCSGTDADNPPRKSIICKPYNYWLTCEMIIISLTTQIMQLCNTHTQHTHTTHTRNTHIHTHTHTHTHATRTHTHTHTHTCNMHTHTCMHTCFSLSLSGDEKEVVRQCSDHWRGAGISWCCCHPADEARAQTACHVWPGGR